MISTPLVPANTIGYLQTPSSIRTFPHAGLSRFIMQSLLQRVTVSLFSFSDTAVIIVGAVVDVCVCGGGACVSVVGWEQGC